MAMTNEEYPKEEAERRRADAAEAEQGYPRGLHPPQAVFSDQQFRSSEIWVHGGIVTFRGCG